jgi:hypothetical protein
VFFLVTAMSLWINELMHGAIALISTSSGVYHAMFITSTTVCPLFSSLVRFLITFESSFSCLGSLWQVAFSVLFAAV